MITSLPTKRISAPSQWKTFKLMRVLPTIDGGESQLALKSRHCQPMYRLSSRDLLGTAVSPAETDGQIEMPLEAWTRASPRNYGLRGGPSPAKGGGNLLTGHLHCKLQRKFGVRSIFATLFGIVAAAMRPFAASTAATCCNLGTQEHFSAEARSQNRTQAELKSCNRCRFTFIGVNSYWAQGLKPPPTFMIMGLAYMTSPPLL